MTETSWATIKGTDVQDHMQDKAIQKKKIWKGWVSKSKYFHFYNYLTMDYPPLEPVQSIKRITTKIQNQRQFWNIHVKWSWVYSYHSSREYIKLEVMSSSLWGLLQLKKNRLF